MKYPSNSVAPKQKASAHARGYSRRWRRARLAYLRQHPLCAYCKKDGQYNPAHVVDHIQPHKGDRQLFWDWANWQGLCTRHHNSTKQKEEISGATVSQDGADGLPINPQHAFYETS